MFTNFEYDKVDPAAFEPPRDAKTVDVSQNLAASLKIDEVMAALKLQPGESVADIGAGAGLYDVPFAKAVGPAGHV